MILRNFSRFKYFGSARLTSNYSVLTHKTHHKPLALAASEVSSSFREKSSRKEFGSFYIAAKQLKQRQQI